jgi:hypothetical protein
MMMFDARVAFNYQDLSLFPSMLTEILLNSGYMLRNRIKIQVIRRWFLTMKLWVQSRVTSCEICGGRIVTEERFSLRFFRFPLIIIMPLLLHAYLSPPPEACHIPDQAAHYHNLGL